MPSNFKKKGIIFCGAAESGKTKLATEILDAYNEYEKVFIPVRGKMLDNYFLFSACTEMTKVILFDDILNLFQLETIVTLPDQIVVNRKHEKPFSIPTPRLILTLDEIIEVDCKILNTALCKEKFDVLVVNP